MTTSRIHARLSDALLGKASHLTYDFETLRFDSISLVFEDEPLLQGPALEAILSGGPVGCWAPELSPEEERLSARLWNLPEVYRRKTKSFTQTAHEEAMRLSRLVDSVVYNFSNGLQVRASEILRHPLHRKVPLALLPDGTATPGVFSRWPLLDLDRREEARQSLLEIETLQQALLEQVAKALNARELIVYLQTTRNFDKSLQVRSLEFDAAQELEWRVYLKEKPTLGAEIRLEHFQGKKIYAYDSFVVQPETGTLIVHPWRQEIRLVESAIREVSSESTLEGPGPLVHVKGELALKTILRFLRTRRLAVKIEGKSQTLGPEKSRTEIHVDEVGNFNLVHATAVLKRAGWTSKAALFLQTLSRGLPFLLGTDAKELAARLGSRRDWDLRLLKHLGLLQYLMMETLAVHFEGSLVEGTALKKEELFSTLQPRIRDLLVAGAGSAFVKNVPLTELCSRSVVASLESFIAMIQKAVESSEAFYSEQGEVIVEGLVEREFRLIYHMLRAYALQTSGEGFRRARSSWLSKISNYDSNPEDLELKETRFRSPLGHDMKSALESLQPLLPWGFRLFLKGQPLQELQEDEFHIDFVLKTDVRPQDLNWFELNPQFFLRGEPVSPDRILELGSGGLIEYGGQLYLVPQKQLPSLRRLERFWQKLQRNQPKTARRLKSDRVYHLPRHQTLELLALRASGVGIRGDEEWKKLCDFYDRLGQAREVFLPASSTRAQLKPYQSIGAQWLLDLYRLRLGALLADDMGLGKTLQTQAFLDVLRTEGEMGKVLIVVPSSLVYNWQAEIQKFTPDIKVHVLNPRELDRLGQRLEGQDSFVVLATYGLMTEHESFLSQYRWNVLVFDEAQNLKNLSAKRTSAARALKANFKIALTGTPMENHYGEFYSLVDLLVPGSLGALEDFRRQFVNTDLITREEMDELRLKMRPLLLRRSKKEILDQLPAKQETKVSLDFEETQKEIYRDIALSCNQRVQEAMTAQGDASVQLQMLTALLRLRQACSDPAALPNVKYNKVPPKLETLRESLEEIVESGESALVFTQFLQTLHHTVELLSQDGLPVFSLHGSLSSAQRQKVLEEFHQSPGGAVLVMTLKTGGVGLNLTKASYVFHLEPWWNPSVENQATDRVHRLGQQRAVQVFRYIMHESLEEKIELLKAHKDMKFQSLLAEVEVSSELRAGSNALTKQDFDFLLGLKS